MTNARTIADLGTDIVSDACNNVALGTSAADALTTGSNNIAVGALALCCNTTGSNNVAVGYKALCLNTTATGNTAVGYSTLGSNTTGFHNTGMGLNTMGEVTTGHGNTAVGYATLCSVTTGFEHTAIGKSALDAHTTGCHNVAVGYNALGANTTGVGNTAIGTNSLINSVTTGRNTAVGYRSGFNQTANESTFIGSYAGESTTGAQNTFVGDVSGQLVSSGTQNTILGRFDGNSCGADIRTSSNHIILSDGAGVPRTIIDSSGRHRFNATGCGAVYDASFMYQMVFNGTSNAGLYMSSCTNGNATGYIQFARDCNIGIGNIARNGTTDQVNYNTSSDYRMKENVVSLSNALDRVAQLQPKRFSWISQASPTDTQDGFLAHEVSSVVPEAVSGERDAVKINDDGVEVPVYQGIDQSKMVPLLTAAIKELKAELDEAKARITALENV